MKMKLIMESFNKYLAEGKRIGDYFETYDDELPHVDKLVDMFSRGLEFGKQAASLMSSVPEYKMIDYSTDRKEVRRRWDSTYVSDIIRLEFEYYATAKDLHKALEPIQTGVDDFVNNGISVESGTIKNYSPDQADKEFPSGHVTITYYSILDKKSVQ